MKSQRPTQEDVAQLAGVSRSTVSLVLNNSKSRVLISEETRQRVLEAAKTLAYSPHPVAQMLVRGRTHIIGVLPLEGTFPYRLSDFYYPYLVGVEREAAVQDYNVLLFTKNQGKGAAHILKEGVQSLRLADGLVLTGNYPDPALLRLFQKEKLPFVLIGRNKLPLDQVDTVVNNHQPTSYEAVRHLLDLNHRQLGLVVDDLSVAYHQERLAGCETAVSETPDAQLTIINSEMLESAETLKQLIESRGITAVLCADRKLGPTFVNLLQQIPLDVPTDLSLIFLVTNNWEMPYTNPTRVNLNRDLKGSVAVQRLVARLEDEQTPFQQTDVPCQFVIGETTAVCNIV